ncbi:MAG TPA: hypothetical protein VJ484_07895, partial [Lysobacter sp.]|nr:hypothetical protein [Lysobacter sp.]
RYKGMDDRKRVELLSKQDFVLREIDGKQTADDLTDQARLEVFNALEWIEAAINNEEAERMVCRTVKATGSNRPTRVCKTAAQLRADQEEARRIMRNDPSVR